MRDILFKAKRIDNGEWVEGLLTIMWGQYHIINPNDENTAYPIDTDTICQYTGLTDKNGNKIWENDIIELDEDIYIVTWEEDDAMFALEDASIVEHFSHVDSKWCEVVGNKFDNPELMKGSGEVQIK